MKSRMGLSSLWVAVLGLCLLAGGLVSAQIPGMESAKITPGLKGQLTGADLSSGSMPSWAPLYPNINKPSVYTDFDMVTVTYATDAKKAAALIPDQLQLIEIPAMPGQAAVNLTFAKYREVEGVGPYMETIVGIPVLFKGNLYIYVPAIYVDSDSGLAAGREAGGYPKKLAVIDLTNYGDLYLGHISRAPINEKTANPLFYDLASVKVRRGGKLVSIPLAANIKPLPFPYNMLIPLPPATGKPEPFTLMTMGLRFFPPLGPEKIGEPPELIDTPWVVTKGEIYEGIDASMDLFPLKEDPVAQKLPFNSVLGAYIVKGTMHTDPREWSVLYKYSK